MTSCIITPDENIKLSGEINASPSKSQTLRAILFATIADGVSIIDNILTSPDTKSMITACNMLGAKIKYLTRNKLEITGTAGKIKHPTDIIDCGNSGIVLRFITSVLSILDEYSIITGDHSIRYNRTLADLIYALRKLGVNITSLNNNNHAPVIIKGPHIFNITELNGEDSQPVSGLIIAAILKKQDTVINIKNPGEKPWVDLTLDWLDILNIKYYRENYNKYIIFGNNIIQNFNYTVPADLSSLAFPVAAAIITNSEITINNVDLSDKQGDKKLLDVFNSMGAKIIVDNNKLYIKKHNSLNNINININNFIDSINILAVVACCAKGTMVISGASIARTKECDRISCLYQELSKMGADIKELSDGLEIKGNGFGLKYCENLCSHNDHRMVMALYIAALFGVKSNNYGSSNSSKIDNIDMVVKSYPNFFEHMSKLRGV